MKFVVTRAAGFIGFHVSERLLAAGHQVARIDNLNDYCDMGFEQARLSLLSSKNFIFYKLDPVDHVGKEMLPPMRDSIWISIWLRKEECIIPWNTYMLMLT